MTLPLCAISTRTARSPKATGQRLPLRGAGASRHPGQALPSVVRAEPVPGKRSHVSGAALPMEDRPFPLSPASGKHGATSIGSGRVRARTHRPPGAQSARKGATPPQSAGASDPPATVRSRPHRPVAPSDRAAPAPPGGLALRATRGRHFPLSPYVETVPGRGSCMSGAALPPEDRPVPLSPASGKKLCGRSGRVRARTHPPLAALC